MPKNKTDINDTTNDCIVNYPEALCRKQQSKTDNSIFRSISFRFKDTWATFPLPEDCITQSVRRNGEVIPNRLALNLGNSEDIRFVSVRKDDNTYERRPFYNRTIKNLIDSEKHDYLRSIAL